MRNEGKAVDQGWLTVEEAAQIADVSRQTVYDWIERAHLRPRVTDDGYQVDAEELARLLAARQVAATTGVRLSTVLGWADEADVGNGD